MTSHADQPDAHAPDEIISEVRANREAFAAEYDYDIRRIFAELKRREEASDRPKVDPAPKRVSVPKAA